LGNINLRDSFSKADITGFNDCDGTNNIHEAKDQDEEMSTPTYIQE
jgi:hypothetical protein